MESRQALMRAELILLAMVVEAGLAYGAANSPAGPAAPAPAPAGNARPGGDSPRTADEQRVEQWISDLDANRFAVRRAAARRLRKAGLDAVAPLAQAADGGQPEVTRQAIGVLKDLCRSTEPAIAQAAQTALSDLAGSRDRWTAGRAAAALSGRKLEVQRLAIAAIEQLGGTVYEVDQDGDEVVIAEVILGKTWRGGDEDLAHLKPLTGTQRLLLYGNAFSDAGIVHLKELRGLNTLKLYCTDTSDAGEAILAQALPQTRIDRRRGAFLGVAGVAHEKGCKIEFVQPGSAAAIAELETQDVITRVDDLPVPDFDGLLAMISKKRPGDEVHLQVLRGNRSLTTKARLGELDVDQF
ncbi:MAG: PDZ domain-containing protein [Pirellulales bacterium]